ncbi:MAG: hypothetical protein ACXAC5_04175 [Promethearchaeota archaeon]|jgi:hypothetical protein
MRYLLTDGSTPNRKNIVKRIVITIIFALTLTAGIFLGRITATNCALWCASMSPPVFTADEDECIFLRGKMICMPDYETTTDF